MTYQIALDNTGLETQEQVDRMAELMQERGYDVVAIRKCSSQNWDVECPVNDQEWMELLELASQA
ncbi:hypothetical protein [Chromobacterium phragmitis]|uniref:hypothetical protein n=1 Tax=Chromobacterium phragmitis TaxID=2202141 RepID=UPI003877FF51